MKKRDFKLKNNEKGITLIALVITIIVLLILAGVSIAMLTGENGILGQAGDAKEETEKREALERVKLEVGGSYDISGKINLDKLNENLKNNITGLTYNGNKISNENKIVELPAVVKVNGINIEIEGNGYVKLKGPQAQISNVKITLDGKNEVQNESLDFGIPVKIDFLAETQEGIIKSITPNLPYTTTGEEMGVEFTISILLDGKEYLTKKYISVESKYKVDHSEIVVPTIEATGVFANNPNIKEVRKGNIPIPKGFDYVKGDVKGGAVIKEEGLSEEEGSNFVWIPVSKTIGNSEEGGTNQGENGETPMAIEKNGNYRGLLYYYYEKNNYAYSDVVTGCTTDDADYQEYREPSNGETDNETTINGWTENLFQEEYNKMIKQVEKYGGFYIGRYETSYKGEMPQSKKGETIVDDNTWYTIYNRQKNYAKESVTSSIIWGSQWDAMINWMLKNNIDVISRNPIDMSIGVTNKNTSLISGNDPRDRISNIFDLLGNYWELTQTLYRNNYRNGRGGEYNYDSSGYIITNYTGANNPNEKDRRHTSRMTLYIK